MALDDLLGKAKESAGGLLGKAKEVAGDGKADGAIDTTAEKIKDLTPDNIDPHVDTVADKIKDALK